MKTVWILTYHAWTESYVDSVYATEELAKIALDKKGPGVIRYCEIVEWVVKDE